MDLIYFGIGVIIYFVIHSVLADNKVKTVLTKIISQRYYRIMYNVVAIITLFPLAKLYSPIRNQFIFEVVWLKYMGLAIAIVGIYILLKALQSYNLSEFIGTHYLKKEKSTTPLVLNTSGLNSWVRHPLYFGTLILVWGFFLYQPTTKVLLLELIITAYLIIGTKLEEQKLIEEFGEQYIEYQKQIPMLIPFF